MRYPLWTAYAASGAYLRTSKLLKFNPFSEAETIHCSQEKQAILLNNDQLKRLNDHRLDFLLSFATAQVDERLSAVPRHGVWRFKYGDDESNDFSPPAFREMAQGAQVLHVSLTQLSSRQQAAAKDLRSGFFAVEPYSYGKTLDRARRASVDFPVLACKDLISGRQGERESKSNPSPCTPTGVPENRLMLGLMLGALRWAASRLLRSSFTQVVWNSGFVDIADLDPTNSQTATRVDWLRVQPDSIAADPFVMRSQNQLALLTENIDKRNGRGFIEAWSIQNGQARLLGKVIDEPVHLSYPYIIEWQGSIYCVPEQAQAHALVLYCATDFPVRWERAGELISEVEAVDPTLFRYGSFWWLAYTDGSIDRYGRLMLWYSRELLGPWTPHALNPVKIDPRSSRGAGRPFTYGNYLVRPAQDCCGDYGARIVFNRITKLTPGEFQEEVIGDLKPDPNGRYPAGLHTVCLDSDTAVIDGKTYVVDPTAWFRKFMRKSALRSRWKAPERESKPLSRSANS
jgi:hypothetical protein